MRHAILKRYFAAALTALSATAFGGEVPAATVMVGNEVGSSQLVDGPGSIAVTLGECRFTLNLVDGDHLRFNDPDLIFYRSKRRLPDTSMPYLSQSEMAIGYDWSFKKQGRLNDRWIGMMCERKSDFPWHKKKNESISPELYQIIQSNSYRCPAIFDGNAWHSISSDKSTTFRSLSGRNWTGFIIGYFNKGDRTRLSRINICIVHNDDVLVGIAENGAGNLNIPSVYFDELARFVSSIVFND